MKEEVKEGEKEEVNDVPFTGVVVVDSNIVEVEDSLLIDDSQYLV